MPRYKIQERKQLLKEYDPCVNRAFHFKDTKGLLTTRWVIDSSIRSCSKKWVCFTHQKTARAYSDFGIPQFMLSLCSGILFDMTLACHKVA